MVDGRSLAQPLEYTFTCLAEGPRDQLGIRRSLFRCDGLGPVARKTVVKQTGQMIGERGCVIGIRDRAQLLEFGIGLLVVLDHSAGNDRHLRPCCGTLRDVHLVGSRFPPHRRPA